MRKIAIKTFCYLVLIGILLSPVWISSTPAKAVLPEYFYMGTVKNVSDESITIQTEYRYEGEWKLYSSSLEGRAPNDDALREIHTGDYVEVGSIGADGSFATLAKMKSKSEKIVTDIYGDPKVLIQDSPPLLGNYKVEYNNTPDCSKCTVGICPAKYTNVTVTGPEVASIQLDPKESYLDDRLAITFHSGQALAYPECTDQRSIGPQPTSNFTIHLYPTDEWKQTIPIPEDVEIEISTENQTYSKVTIYFGCPSEFVQIPDWGSVKKADNKFSVDAKIYTRPCFVPQIYPLPEYPKSHYYSLGDLSKGKYQFIFKVWNRPVKGKDFIIGIVWDKSGIFPNPVTSSMVTLHLEAEFDTVTLMIFDLSGTEVLEKTYSKNDAIVDLSHLDNGVYLYVLMIQKDGNSLKSPVKKLLVQR